MILLEKSLEEIMKKQNLPNLVIDRIERSGGQVRLCTPCGKPMMFIRDVRIPKAKLTMEEREFILKKLSIFFMENTETIKEVLEIVMNPIEPKKYPDYEVFVSTSSRWNGRVKYTSVGRVDISIKNFNRKDGKFSLSYYPETEEQKESFGVSTKNISVDELKETIAKIDDMVETARDAVKNQEDINEQENKLSEYNSCSW